MIRSSRFVIAIVTWIASSTAYAGGSPSFDVSFDECTEFVGIASVDIKNVQGLVPTELTILGDGSNALIVVRIVDCDAISVDGRRPRPGRTSQIGVSVVGDGSADIDNYTLWYGTDHPRLKAKLTATGMRTAFVPRLRYDVELDDDRTGVLRTRVLSRALPLHAVTADVEAPVADPVPFVARWIANGRRGTVEMLTTFPRLVFGVADSVLRTPPRSALAAVFGDNSVTFGILDSYNAWDQATMIVSVD